MQTLLPDPALRSAAIRGLAMFEDAKTPDAILGVFKDLPLIERRDALNTLASRPNYAKALFAAVDAKKINPKDITADLVRQLRNLGDKSIDDRIAKTFQDGEPDPRPEAQADRGGEGDDRRRPEG